MPLLADTIVECGRRTLTNAINLAESWGTNLDSKYYGCKVIYGDTDSSKLPNREFLANYKSQFDKLFLLPSFYQAPRKIRQRGV